MKRRIWLIPIVIPLLLVLCAGLSGCKSHQPSWMSWPESPAEDFQYTVSEDGKEIWIIKYVGSSETVVIPAKIDGLPVTSLQGVENPDYGFVTEGVFQDHTTVKEVVLPHTLIYVGMSAFSGCTSLTNVYIPENSPLEVIGASAFWGCTALQSMDLSPTKVWIIADDAFRSCSALTEFRFSHTLTEIRENAFFGCSSLLEAHLPDSLTTVGNDAFAGCAALKRVTIPPKLEIGSMRNPLFYGVPALEQVIFTEGREALVGHNLLHITSKVEIVIPKSVTRFGGDLFVTDGKIPVRLRFLGDCPSIERYEQGIYNNYTVYYDPTAQGWENSVWADVCTLKPME